MSIRKLAAVLAFAGIAAHAQTPALKDAFKGFFHVGAALNPAQFEEHDTLGAGIVRTHFDTISPENILKWEVVHPRVDAYAFDAADKYVAFGEKYKMFIVGHTLVWHSQVPAWVFKNDKGETIDREGLLKRLQEHIQTVVGRYKGRINGWDVVNEALNEDGTLRQSPWLKIIGEDFMVKAFQFAHEADPKAELYYNDYSVENPAKRAGAVKLIKSLQAAGVTVHAMGLQGHDKMEWPTLEQQEATIVAFKDLGIKVNITELDIDVLPQATQQRTADVSLSVEAQAKLNPYANGLPDAMQQALAKRYADLFAVFCKYRGTVSRITFWGVRDSDSWLNGWPIRGRTSYPLLFDKDGKPKPAFQAIVDTAKKAR
ncbi:MAG: endo-1,4-beta-xylanase [Candidatus Solibacter sp.]